MKNEEVLHGVKVEMNYLTHNKRRKVNWIGHILCRNCFLIHVTEEKGRERRSKQLLEAKGYWKLKEEALDRTLWRTRF